MWPELIERMVAGLQTGCYMVVASRYQHSSRVVGLRPFRQTMSDGARILFQLFVGVPGVRDYTCGYRAYRAELLQRALAEFSGCLSGERGLPVEAFAPERGLTVTQSSQARRAVTVSGTAEHMQQAFGVQLSLQFTVR